MNGRARASGYDWIWAPTRLAIYHRDRFTCALCGFRCCPSEALRSGLTLDHVEPDGGNTPANLITLCSACNASKGMRGAGHYKTNGFAAKVRKQLAKPINREVGRVLCFVLRPGFIEENGRRRERRKSPAAMVERAEQLAEVPF